MGPPTSGTMHGCRRAVKGRSARRGRAIRQAAGTFRAGGWSPECAWGMIRRMDPHPAIPPEDPDAELVAGLRAGQEAAFVTLVQRYQRMLLGVARRHVREDSAAEDVVQEAWLGVLDGIARFEGRSTFRTWLFRIAEIRAISRSRRDARTVPLGGLPADDGSPTVDPGRFLAAGRAWAGHWSVPPNDGARTPPNGSSSGRTQAVVRRAIEELPPTAGIVVTPPGRRGLVERRRLRRARDQRGQPAGALHRARARLPAPRWTGPATTARCTGDDAVGRCGG